MEHRVSYTVIGAFVIILGGLLVAGLLWLASGGATTEYRTYTLFLKSGAASLNRDSSVLYHGVPVGRVSDIGLDPNDPTRARVLLAIREKVPIKRDTRAAVETRGVTGAGFVNLSGGSKASPPLTAKSGQPYPVIPARSGGMQSLTSAAQDVAQRVVKVSARLEKVLSDKNLKAISDSLQNIRDVTSSLKARSKQLDTTLTELNGTLANARKASTQLPTVMKQIHSTVARIQTVVDKVGKATDGVDRTATRFRQLTPQAAELLQRLDAASQSLNTLLQELNRQPSELISGKPKQPGPGEQGAGGSGG